MTPKKKLVQTIKEAPNFWFFRPFYDSPLFQDGYRVSYSYVGIMDDLESCAKAVRHAIVYELEAMTDKEFKNHPVVYISVETLAVTFYVGGPGSGDPPPPPPPPPPPGQ